METSIALIAVFLVCLVLSFLFSGMEAGVLALSRLRIRQYMKAGRKGARILNGFLEDPENFLWTIVVGNTLANLGVIFIMIGGLYFAVGHSPVLFVALVSLGIFFFYALCDLLPKMLFRMFPNRLCMAMTSPFRFIDIALAPLVQVVAWFAHGLLLASGGSVFTGRIFGNRTELRLFMQASSHRFTSEERSMINRVLDLQNLTVRSITTPMKKLTAVQPDTSGRHLIKIFRRERFSRLPVWGTDHREARIIGIVSLDHLIFSPLFDPNRKAGDFLQPVMYLNEDLPLDEALSQMQRAGQRMAIVLGRDRKEIGAVTLQDILLVIFGEVSL